MNLIEAFILGVVQGISEFLPVSSSGHLVLLQRIFGIEEPVLLFNIMVHVGTLVAVCTVLWQDIFSLLRNLIQPLALFIIIATIPAVMAALFFKGYIEELHSSASFLGFAFLITSGLLLFSELFSKKLLNQRAVKTETPAEDKCKNCNNNSMNWLDALVIGIFQAIAIIPGISRSGATLAGGLFRKIERNFTVRFSFLLSIPAILGGLTLELIELGRGGYSGGIGVAPMITGAVSAAIVGFFSIKLMLKIVRERSLLGFALYTGILGFLILIDWFGTRFFL